MFEHLRIISKETSINLTPVFLCSLSCLLLELHSSTSELHSSTSELQATKMVIIWAKFGSNCLKFSPSLKAKLGALKQEVHKRLNLADGTYYIKYKHGDNVVLVACDEDVTGYIEYFRSTGKDSIVLQLERKEDLE